MGLEAACTVDLSSIKLDMERISEGAIELEKQLALITESETAATKTAGAADEQVSAEDAVEAQSTPFVLRLSTFEAQMKEKAAALHSRKENMDEALERLAKMFGEESDNAAWVLRTLHTFSKQYAAAAEDNKKV